MVTVTVDVVFFLLLAAVMLFVLAAGVVTRLVKPWLLPIGLACVALALLVEWKF